MIKLINFFKGLFVAFFGALQCLQKLSAHRIDGNRRRFGFFAFKFFRVEPRIIGAFRNYAFEAR